MTSADLHQQLVQACHNGTIEDVKCFLEAGIDPNFNLKSPLNALGAAIEHDRYEVIELLLDHGAIVKEFVLQKAIQRDKHYLDILFADFSACRDGALLLSLLRAAINSDDFELAKQAIAQGAVVQKLHLHDLEELDSVEILELLLENGFDIHIQQNMLLTIWLGSALIGEIGHAKRVKHHLLSFIAEYYLDKPASIEKFKEWRLINKSYLFREGLGKNNIPMMQFALLIGADKNSSLGSALNKYYKQDDEVAHVIVKYILGLDITFSRVTIQNALFFSQRDVLNAISRKEDLEYAYEMAYSYEKEDLCQFFADKGVTKEAQELAKMRVSAIQGDIKELRSAIKSGADPLALTSDDIVAIINKNQVESLRTLCDAGLVIGSSLNSSLDEAMHLHKAYETVSYLIEKGLDMSSIKRVPQEYKKRYPALADMREKRFRDIFDYTIYLVQELYPNQEGKDKEQTLQRIAQLSALPYVRKKAQEYSDES